MTGADLKFQPSDEELKILREWIEKVPYIVQDYDDKFLAGFVRGCKGSLQKTKRILEGFNSLGSTYPEYFSHFDMLEKKISETLNIVKVFPLPRRTKDGSIVLIVAIDPECTSDPYKIHIFEILRYGIMTLYVFLWEDLFGAGKVILIFDLKNLRPVHVRELTPTAIKQLFKIQENSLPIRLQAAHHVNSPPFLEWVFNFVKTFAKKKIVDRTTFFSDIEPLYSYVEKELLPKDYGGDEEDMNTMHDRWKKKVESYRELFVKENFKMRNLDPLRPKDENSEEMIGTFKKLNVD